MTEKKIFFGLFDKAASDYSESHPKPVQRPTSSQSELSNPQERQRIIDELKQQFRTTITSADHLWGYNSLLNDLALLYGKGASVKISTSIGEVLGDPGHQTLSITSNEIEELKSALKNGFYISGSVSVIEGGDSSYSGSTHIDSVRGRKIYVGLVSDSSWLQLRSAKQIHDRFGDFDWVKPTNDIDQNIQNIGEKIANIIRNGDDRFESFGRYDNGTS